MVIKILTLGLCTYNNEDVLDECMESIIQNIEFIDSIIINNNGSTDNTKSICERYAKLYPQKIILINHEINKGPLFHFYFFSNYDIKTKYFMFARPKDRLSKDYVKMTLEELEKDPDNVACYTNYYFKTTPYSYNNEYVSITRPGLDNPDPYQRVLNYNKTHVAHGTSIIWGVLKTSALKNLAGSMGYRESNGRILSNSIYDHSFVLRLLVQGKFCKAEKAYLYKIWWRPKEDPVEGLIRYKDYFGLNPYSSKYIMDGYNDIVKIIQTIPDKPDNWEEDLVFFKGYDYKNHTINHIKNVLSYKLRKYICAD